MRSKDSSACPIRESEYGMREGTVGFSLFCMVGETGTVLVSHSGVEVVY